MFGDLTDCRMSQLIIQNELLFNISCKIAYFSIVSFVILICIIII